MNIPEILVANGTGAVLVCFLFLLRVRGESKNSVGSELFCQMLVVTLLAQATETISFLLDGVPGAASRFWLYLMNTVCTGAAVSVGFVWCLYVDFRVYRSTGRLRRRHLFLGAPLLAVLALLTANLFGTGWIFTISADNVYHRGPLNSLLYLLLFGYYAESVWQVHKAKRDGVTVEFFSVYYFVITCAVGTVLQGAFYGMAFGWLSVAIMGALWPLLVMTGMHRVFTPTIIQTIAETGKEGMVMPSEIGANLSLGGSSLAVAWKTKNPELRQTALAAAASAIMAGISEPALYGVAVRLKRPLIASLISGFICGAVAGIAGLASHSMAAPGLFTSVQFFDPANPMTIVWVFGVMALAVVLSFVLTLILGFEDIPVEDDAEKARALQSAPVQAKAAQV